jgi:uncharacterized coiled-coil protein SlyX
MDEILKNIIQIKILAFNEQLNKFDAKNHNITNLSKPNSDSDAINYITLKDYCFKNYNNIIDNIKKDINKIYDILKYTSIDALEFSKLNLEDGLKEKILYLNNLVIDNTQLLNEYIYKYNSLEKKTTLLEFKKVNLENQIEELQDQIVNLQNERLNKNKLTYVQEDVKIMYIQLKDFLNSLFNSTKLNFDKVYIDITFLNDKFTEFNKLITSNQQKIDKIILNNQTSDVIDNCLYKFSINSHIDANRFITIDNISPINIIKRFYNAKIYDDVRLCKIKYTIDYYNENDILMQEKFNSYIKLKVENVDIDMVSDTFIANLKVNNEENFINLVSIPNVFKSNKKIKYVILYINLIFRIKLL